MKPRAPIFTSDSICDNEDDMLLNSQAFDPEHPLQADRERLDRILDVMYAKIQRTLFPWRNPRRRPRAETEPSTGDSEWVLYGTGVSAEDVLSEALIELLQYPPKSLKGTWEGLAVRIARNKAVDALRVFGKGLRGTDHRGQLNLVSGAVEREGPDGETEPPIFDETPSEWGDPEAEYLEHLELEATLKLRDLARELLDDRQQRIFFAIHFDDHTRREVGEQLGWTSQRIGQIYKASLLTLVGHPDYPFKPPITVGQLTERRS